ncbi:hypothetical protein EVAR_91938_1 [Eumeta japonica]|uniref:DUF5641 domain-containing protein n=1 Tax=Eumeta variegata TaxID=151549 RepID=A0A4C1SWI6_EUMVA|nr:hypothetical protein EVAR_91938_1 [Eumeta japonica]
MGHFDTSEECSRNSGERVRRSQRCSGRDGCENTSHAAETSQVDRGRPPIKVGDAVVITDPPYHVTRGRGHRRTGLQGSTGKVRVVDIRTAHGRLRRPTARLAVLPPKWSRRTLRPGWIVDGRITTAARLSLRPPIDKEM